MCDNLYAYKYASQAAHGILRTLNRLQKSMEKERPVIQAQRAEYLESEEYKKLQASFKEKDDDDDYKYDKDPSGFELINKVFEGELYGQHLDFILKVYRSNTKDSRFLVKAIKAFIKLEKFELLQQGLDKLKAIREEKGDNGEYLYARSLIAKATVPEAKKEEAKDLQQEKVEDLKKELDGLKLEKLEELEFFIKASKELDHKVGDLSQACIKMLSTDPWFGVKERVCERVCQVLNKKQANEAPFRTKCKELFTLSTFFKN